MTPTNRRPTAPGEAPSSDAAPSKPDKGVSTEPALLARLQELRNVFRAATALDLSMVVSESHMSVGEALGEAIYWLLRDLLSDLSRWPEAGGLILTSDRQPDGSVRIRLRERGAEASAGTVTPAPLDVASIGRRIRELGGHVDSDTAAGLIVEIVVPGRASAP
jgi:hypothetical protein